MATAKFPEPFEFLFEPHRVKGVRGGRGKGASWNFARALLIKGSQNPTRILCARETQKSIQDSVHALLSDQVKALGLSKFYEVQQSTILGKNGTEFIFAGLRHNINNIKSVEGCDIVWVEEAQSVSRDSWATLIPTIRKEKSEIWLSWNDLLETDDTHKRFVLNPPPGAVIKKLTYRDNPYFPEVLRVEMEHLKATDYQEYLHVWEGECKSTVEGAIFGEEMKKATAEGRITNVPYDRTKPVDTFWDLGYGDTNAIWFAQAYGGWYNFIDYLEDDGKEISAYLIQMQNRGYVYGTDFLPHDGVDAITHGRLSGDRSKSPDQVMRSSGRNVRITPKLLVKSRIDATRRIFPQCRFDAEKCADGLQALRNYQWAPISATGRESGQELHNWASHGASALCTAGVMIKTPIEHEQKKEARRAPPADLFGGGVYRPFG